MTHLFRTIAPGRRHPCVRGHWAILGCLVLLSIGTAEAATIELAGPDGARLIINDKSTSYLPLHSPLQLAPGDYTIRCELAGYQPYEQKIKLVSGDWLRLRIRMTRLSRTTATLGNIPIAGMGQFYMGKKTKGWVFLLAEAGGLMAALAGELQRSDYRKDYLLLKDKYDGAINGDEIAHYRQLSATAYQNMEDMESLRDTGLIIAGSAIVLSMLDALLLFPAAEVGAGPPPVTGWRDEAAPDGFDRLTSFHVGLRLSF